MDILDRFLQYVSIDTQSTEHPAVRNGSEMPQPSAEKELVLARILRDELERMGAADVRLTEYGYVYAKIPAAGAAKTAGDAEEAGAAKAAGRKKEADAAKAAGAAKTAGDAEKAGSAKAAGPADALPRLGFIAHMDTSPSAPGNGVRPRIVERYDGRDIALSGGRTLSPDLFPELKKAAGCTLVVTDGTTLLGADDKAGVAEIMTMAEYFLSHPEIPHGEIKIAFTPDEEVGRGTEHFDIEAFGADAAFTVDGDELGKIEYENFNAASGTVRIRGVNVHPGSAKGRMINASLEAMAFNALLPACIPANTEKYEGFFHLTGISGDESLCEMHYIIRDHDREKFEEKKRVFLEAAEKLNRKFAGTDAHATAQVRDSYYNMKEKIVPANQWLLDLAAEAMRKAGVTPFTEPIRGGTDGAMLSWKGLPCPNLPTGGGNYHGVYEYLNVDAMRTMAEVLKNIVMLQGKFSADV